MLESRCPGLVPGMTQGFPGTLAKGGQNVRRLDRERDRAGAGLAVGKAELVGLQVHLLPAQRQDLVAPAAGEHEQADGGDAAWGESRPVASSSSRAVT